MEFQPTPIRTGHGGTEGRPAMVDFELVAVLVRLDDPVHDDDRGKRFMEVGFGRCGRSVLAPTFRDLEEAASWIEQRTEMI